MHYIINYSTYIIILRIYIDNRHAIYACQHIVQKMNTHLHPSRIYVVYIFYGV